MGVEPKYERYQYAQLNREQPHPLENPQLPYGMQLIVNGAPVRPERICDKLYVPIDPTSGPVGAGPDIGIRLFNHCGQPVYMVVYIDGLNMIDQVRELPYLTPTGRHWYVRNGYDSVLRHWFFLQPGQPMQRARLQLVNAAQAVAPLVPLPAGQNQSPAYGECIDDRLGMITCMIYTYGWDRVPEVRRELKTMGAPAQFAIGEGIREQTQVNRVKGSRGIMLAAMTLHYRTTQELEQIRQMSCDPAQAGVPVPEAGATAVESQTSTKNPSLETNQPGRSTPFTGDQTSTGSRDRTSSPATQPDGTPPEGENSSAISELEALLSDGE